MLKSKDNKKDEPMGQATTKEQKELSGSNLSATTSMVPMAQGPGNILVQHGEKPVSSLSQS